MHGKFMIVGILYEQFSNVENSNKCSALVAHNGHRFWNGRQSDWQNCE